MIESRLVERPELDGYALYLWIRLEDGRRLPFRMEGDRLRTEEAIIGSQSELPPTMLLSYSDHLALRRAFAEDLVNTDDATKDARATRDRLLTLIEALVGETIGPRR